MSAIPGIVAKVKRIVMINPGYKGKQNPAVLYTLLKNVKLKKFFLLEVHQR